MESAPPVPSVHSMTDRADLNSKGPGLPERIAAYMRRDVPLAVLDGVTVLVGYLVMLVLRFDGAVPSDAWDAYRVFMPAAVSIHLIANYLFGLYGQMWRYASVEEARRVGLAALSGGTLVFAASQLWAMNAETLPRSVIILGSILSLTGFGTMRFQNRLFAIRRLSAVDDRARILLVGAGEAGAMVVKDVFRNPSAGLIPVGLVDDDRRKLGRKLNGVEVLGNRSSIPYLVSKLKIDQVFLTIPSANSEVVQDVVALCEEAEVPLQVLPSVGESFNGKVSVRDMRDLRIEDLLGRQQVDTDLAGVARMLTGKRVLITGAGGSIGSEIVRQVASFDPAKLILLDNDETHLHDVITQLDSEHGVVMVLGDVREQGRMLEMFARHQPQVVFHAAAHKHVPILEVNPGEALLTNIIGTANVADAAVTSGVERFVLISTDKAIRPQSVMGSSKWFAEQIVRSLQWNDCTFCAVRFGNVLGSRGSVIPTFLRQIGQGGPVTVTDTSMTRYFMSVQEAVQLVLQAGALSSGGEVFTLDMGEPVKIIDLARKLIRLSGRVPDKDIAIEVVGVRPGEKLREDITDADEDLLPSGHLSIVASKPPVPDPAALRKALRELEMLAREGNDDQLAAAIKHLAQHKMADYEGVQA